MEALAHLAHEAVAAMPRDAVALPASAARASPFHPATRKSRPRPRTPRVQRPTSKHGQANAPADAIRDDQGRLATIPPVDGLPGSQESYVSASSTASTAPRLRSLGSNLSTESVADSELTSPATSNASHAQPKSSSQVNQGAGTPVAHDPARVARPITPQLDTAPRDAVANASAITSPMSVDTPTLTQGSKRTASGTVKHASVGSQGKTGLLSGLHSRTTSSDSNVSRIGQLSAELKTRLSYAMVKVQNGWEQKSIDELETVASQRTSPSLQTSVPRHSRSTTVSPRSYHRPRRSSGFSQSSDPYPVPLAAGHSSPSTFSRALGQYSSNMVAPEIHIRPSTASTVSSTASSTPSLAAPAEIVPRRHRRSSSNRAPMLSAQRVSRPFTDAGVPSTPTGKSRPAGILRLPSQQAEMDAVDSLLFMSSPNNSAHFAHTSANSTAQPSPLRSEFASARKFAFDDRSSSSAGVSENENNTRLAQMAEDRGPGAAGEEGGASKRAKAAPLGGERGIADSG